MTFLKVSILLFFWSYIGFSQVTENLFGFEDRGYGRLPSINGVSVYYQFSLSLAESTNKKMYLYRSQSQGRENEAVFSFYDELQTFYQILSLTDQQRDDFSLEHHGPGCGHLQVLKGAESPLWLMSQEEVIPFHSLNQSQPQLEKAIAAVDSSKMLVDIQKLESLKTRFHTTKSGQATPQTIFDMIQALNLFAELDVELFTHEDTDQKSLIVRQIGETEPDQIMIFGAHLDSINRRGTDAPGADDDASGVALLIEMIRVIHGQKIKFHKTIEWHFYAAEEVGLVGSTEVASTYASSSTNVLGMIQFDMLAWSQDKRIYLIDTDTSQSLTDGLASLLDLYQISSYERAVLSAGTSDHRAWFSKGYPVAFPFENPTDFNPGWHSDIDDSEHLKNFDVVTYYAQLALVAAGHYAGLIVSPTGSTSNDINIAITLDTFFASLPETATRVFACQIKEVSSECLGTSTQLSYLRSAESRKVFYTQDLSLSANKNWLVWSTSEQETEAARKFSLTSKALSQ